MHKDLLNLLAFHQLTKNLSAYQAYRQVLLLPLLRLSALRQMDLAAYNALQLLLQPMVFRLAAQHIGGP